MFNIYFSWYPGAQYHIMCSGNHRAEIYCDDEDRQVYLALLEEARNKYDITLISYCLMSNHVHLQIETADISPGLFILTKNILCRAPISRKVSF